MDELLSLPSAGVSTKIFAKRIISTGLKQSAATQSACSEKYPQILSLLYLNSVILLLGSGITFIELLLLFFFIRFYWGWVTGTFFINRSQTEVFGEAVGITFIVDCLKEGNRDLVKSVCLYQGHCYSHHLPVTEGRFLGRRGEGGELVLGLLWPLFGGLNHLPGVSGHRQSSDGSGVLLRISRTTGGRSAWGMREVAAASGGSAPMSSLMSGKAARGGV